MTRLIESVARSDKPRVRLVGEDGNAYSILGRIISAWKHTNHPLKHEIAAQYREEATSDTYKHLLNISREYIREDKSLYYLYEGEKEEQEESLAKELFANMLEFLD